MSAAPLPESAQQTRPQRIDAILHERQPKIDAAGPAMVAPAVDLPEAAAVGASALAFRAAGLNLANQVRQASRARRKQRATEAAA